MLVRDFHSVGQRERGVESSADLIHPYGELADCSLGSDALASHAGVLFGKELFGDPIGEVRRQELLLLLLESSELLFSVLSLDGFLAGQFAESDARFGLERGALRCSERDGRVVGGDCLLDHRHAVVGLAAAVELAPGAEEVLVGAALAFAVDPVRANQSFGHEQCGGEGVADPFGALVAGVALGVRIEAVDDRVFVYADPPYLVQGDRLYLDAMPDAAHRRFADVLRSGEPRWLLTYDADARIHTDLYAGLRTAEFSMTHSAAIQRRGFEFAVFPDGLVVDRLDGLGSGEARWLA